MSKLTQIIESHLPKEKNTAEENLKGLLDEEIRDMMFYQSAWNSCLEEIKKAIPKMEEEIVKHYIAILEQIDKEKWNDAEHCSCLGYAISLMKGEEPEEYERLLTTLTK